MASTCPWERQVTIHVASKKDPTRILDFQLNVIDTYPDTVANSRPTVLAVHGIPGGCSDYYSLASTLHQLGIRLIAPSEIGMGQFPLAKQFVSHIDFSTFGRVDHLGAVLEALGVTRVDLMLGHSAGAWPACQAVASWDTIGALMLINPAGAEPNKPYQPYWLHLFWTWLLTWTILWIFAVPLATFLVRQAGFKVDFGTKVILTVLYSGNHDFKDVPLSTLKVREKGVPTVVAYSKNDKLISQKIFDDMAYKYLGIPRENTTVYSDDRTPNRDPFFVSPGWFSRCMIFQRGGHIVHVAHEKEVVDQIQDLLKRSRSFNQQQTAPRS